MTLSIAIALTIGFIIGVIMTNIILHYIIITNIKGADESAVPLHSEEK